MIHELVCAKTSNGIFKNTSGFCAVAVNEKFPTKLVRPLVELAKKQVKNQNRFNVKAQDFFAHFPMSRHGQKVHVLTRGSVHLGEDDEPEYVVHQIVMDEKDLKTAGPSAILANESIWYTRWETSPQLLKPRTLDIQPLAPRICRTWEDNAGDAGWAGVPFESYESNRSCIILSDASVPASERLKLIVESQSLMPNELRWKILISIGAWHPFKTDNRFWTAADRGTQAGIDSMSKADCERIDLSTSLVRSTSRYAKAARSGQWISPKLAAGGDPSKSLRVSGIYESTIPANEDNEAYELENKTADPKSPSSLKQPHLSTAAAKRKTTAGKKSTLEEHAMAASASTKVAKKSSQSKRTMLSSSDSNVSPGKTLEVDSTYTQPSGEEPKPRLKKGLSTQIKLGLVAGGGILLLLAAWLGQGYLSGVADSLNETKNPAVPVPRIKNPKDNGPESAEPVTSEAEILPVEGLTPASVSRLFGRINPPAANIPPGSKEQQLLFQFPAADPSLDKFINFSIVMPNRRVSLNRDKEIERWLLKMSIEKGNVPVAWIQSTLAPKEGVTRFYWTWIESLPEKQVRELLAGMLVANVEGARGELAVPLCLPSKATPPFRLIDFNYQLADLEPHLPELLTLRRSYQNYKWNICDLVFEKLKDLDPTGVWQSSDIHDENLTIVMDSKKLLEEVAGLLGVSAPNEEEGENKTEPQSDQDSVTGRGPKSDKQKIAPYEVLEEIVRKRGPFGLQSRLRLSCDEENRTLSLNSKAYIMISSLGDDIPAIYIASNRTLNSKKPESLEEHRQIVASNLMNGLADYFNLAREEFEKVAKSSGGGYAVFSEEKQMDAALAGVLYKHFMVLLNAEARVSVNRVFRNKKGWVVKAISFDD